VADVAGAVLEKFGQRSTWILRRTAKNDFEVAERYLDVSPAGHVEELRARLEGYRSAVEKDDTRTASVLRAPPMKPPTRVVEVTDEGRDKSQGEAGSMPKEVAETGESPSVATVDHKPTLLEKPVPRPTTDAGDERAQSSKDSKPRRRRRKLNPRGPLSDKIVLNHSTHIPGLLPMLSRLIAMVEQNEHSVSTVVPGRVSQSNGRSVPLSFRVTTSVKGGWKIVARKSSMVQEVFFVTDASRIELIDAVAETFKLYSA